MKEHKSSSRPNSESSGYSYQFTGIMKDRETCWIACTMTMQVPKSKVKETIGQ